MTSTIQPRYAPQHAGNLVALTETARRERAQLGPGLRRDHLDPAEISGMGGRYGVLKPGAARRRGDLGRRSARTQLGPAARVHRRRRAAARQPPDASCAIAMRRRRRAILPKAYEW